VVASIDPVHGNYSIIYEIPKNVFSVVNPTPSVLNPVSNTFSFFMDISPVGYLVTISTKDYSAVTLQPVHYHNSTSSNQHKYEQYYEVSTDQLMRRHRVVVTNSCIVWISELGRRSH